MNAISAAAASFLDPSQQPFPIELIRYINARFPSMSPSALSEEVRKVIQLMVNPFATDWSQIKEEKIRIIFLHKLIRIEPNDFMHHFPRMNLQKSLLPRLFQKLFKTDPQLAIENYNQFNVDANAFCDQLLKPEFTSLLTSSDLLPFQLQSAALAPLSNQHQLLFLMTKKLLLSKKPIPENGMWPIFRDLEIKESDYIEWAKNLIQEGYFDLKILHTFSFTHLQDNNKKELCHIISHYLSQLDISLSLKDRKALFTQALPYSIPYIRLYQISEEELEVIACDLSSRCGNAAMAVLLHTPNIIDISSLIKTASHHCKTAERGAFVTSLLLLDNSTHQKRLERNFLFNIIKPYLPWCLIEVCPQIKSLGFSDNQRLILAKSVAILNPSLLATYFSDFSINNHLLCLDLFLLALKYDPLLLQNLRQFAPFLHTVHNYQNPEDLAHLCENTPYQPLAEERNNAQSAALLLFCILHQKNAAIPFSSEVARLFFDSSIQSFLVKMELAESIIRCHDFPQLTQCHFYIRRLLCTLASNGIALDTLNALAQRFSSCQSYSLEWDLILETLALLISAPLSLLDKNDLLKQLCKSSQLPIIYDHLYRYDYERLITQLRAAHAALYA